MNPNVANQPRVADANSVQQGIADEAKLSTGQGEISRRDFCTDLLVSSVLIVGTGSLSNQTVSGQEGLLAYPPQRIEGAEKLIVGSSLYFSYPTRNDPAVLLRLSEGQYSAFSRKCSHAGCSVEVDTVGRCLKCPCHRGMYDARIGYVMYGPPQRPLDQIVLQMRAGTEVWAVGKCMGSNKEKFARSDRREGNQTQIDPQHD